MDISLIKPQFPIFKRKINDKPLTYLDSAASAQKPQQVMDAMEDFMRTNYANVNRGVYTLSEEATEKVEQARDKVAHFIHSRNSDEIIFTKNATESINLVANTWGKSNLTKDSIVVITEMEHHSNIVPWQLLQQQIGFELRFITVSKEGYLNWDDFVNGLTPEELNRIKLLSVTHVSNVLGSVNRIPEKVAWAHEHKITVLVDGAQGVTQFPVNVVELDVDFYVFSGHKIYGPTGIGVLYGKKELLDAMPPFLGGGDMILEVTKNGSTFQETPHKFEAGTPPIVEIVGLGAAIDFVRSIGMDNIRNHHVELLEYAHHHLATFQDKGLKLYGPTNVDRKGGVISFVMKGVHPHDIASILDSEGIAIRSGHHCAQPLCARYGESAMARISFGVYNDKSDIEALIKGLEKVRTTFKLE